MYVFAHQFLLFFLLFFLICKNNSMFLMNGNCKALLLQLLVVINLKLAMKCSTLLKVIINFVRQSNGVNNEEITSILNHWLRMHQCGLIVKHFHV